MSKQFIKIPNRNQDNLSILSLLSVQDLLNSFLNAPLIPDGFLSSSFICALRRSSCRALRRESSVSILTCLVGRGSCSLSLVLSFSLVLSLSLSLSRGGSGAGSSRGRREDRGRGSSVDGRVRLWRIEDRLGEPSGGASFVRSLTGSAITGSSRGGVVLPKTPSEFLTAKNFFSVAEAGGMDSSRGRSLGSSYRGLPEWLFRRERRCRRSGPGSGWGSGSGSGSRIGSLPLLSLSSRYREGSRLPSASSLARRSALSAFLLS